MNEQVLQFGVRPENFVDRICAYAIIFDEQRRLLVLKINETFHLPGGGVEEGENHEMAVKRESIEEAGCELTDLEFLGKANQYFLKPEMKNLNKVATFYLAKMVCIDSAKSSEPDHYPYWLSVDEFLNSSARDFQKWAVRKATGRV